MPPSALADYIRSRGPGVLESHGPHDLTRTSCTMAQTKLPGPLLDLTTDNITPNVVRISTQSGNARVNYLMERLITHLHDFARETRLSTTEWMAALDFLVRCGQTSSDVKHVSLALFTWLGIKIDGICELFLFSSLFSSSLSCREKHGPC